MFRALLIGFVVLMMIGQAKANDGKTMIVKVCTDPNCNESSFQSPAVVQAKEGQASCDCEGSKRGHLFSRLKGKIHRPHLFHRRGCQ